MLVGPTKSVSYSLRSRALQEVDLSPSPPVGKSPPAKAASNPVQLFSNGQFVGGAQLSSPETLATLFQLNDDGTVKHGELGSPVTKKGVQLNSSQEHMTKFLAMGPSETWSAADRAIASDLSKITQDDKTMFRQVTGYNLFISGPAMMIVDDEGNPPSPSEAAAVDELFQRMRYTRETGGNIDADWFNGVSKDLKDWDGPAFPTDWTRKSEDWFNQLFENRANRSEVGGDVTLPKATIDTAIAAYSERIKLDG